MIFLSAFTVLQKAQQAQNNLTPSVWVAVLANVFNVCGNYCFIWTLGLGYAGSPLATSLSRVVSFFLLVILSWAYPPPPPTVITTSSLPKIESYGSISHGAPPPYPDEQNVILAGLSGLRQFLSLGLPGGCMMLFESWSFFLVTIESGLLGVVQLAASQVMLAYCSLIFFTFGAAVGSAGTIRVGNLVGAQQPVEAKIAAQRCIGLGTVLMLTLGTSTYVARFKLGPIFSNDPAVWAIVARLAPLTAMNALFDGFQACCSSVLRALGRQSQSAIIYGMGFWGFGLPGGALLCFWYGMGVFGLWWGINIGLFWVCVLSVFVLVFVDWQQETERALERTKVPVDGTKSVV